VDEKTQLEIGTSRRLLLKEFILKWG